MPRKDGVSILIQASPEEDQLLRTYCKQVQRSKSDVVRELIRNLDEKLK